VSRFLLIVFSFPLLHLCTLLKYFKSRFYCPTFRLTIDGVQFLFRVDFCVFLIWGSTDMLVENFDRSSENKMGFYTNLCEYQCPMQSSILNSVKSSVNHSFSIETILGIRPTNNNNKGKRIWSFNRSIIQPSSIEVSVIRSLNQEGPFWNLLHSIIFIPYSL